MGLNMTQWWKSLIGKQPAGALPLLSFPCVQLLGISMRELITSSEMQAAGMKAIADRTPSLASVSFMDLSVEAEAFGSRVRFSDDEIPNVAERIVVTEEDAKALCIPEIGAGRTQIGIDAVKKAVELIHDRPVFAGMIGPFSLTGRLVDVSEAMTNCYDEPRMMKLLLDKTSDFLIRYAQAYKEAGAHGIVMAEPLTGLLSPALAGEFSEPYVKKIVDAVQDDRFAVIYHNCGDTAVRMIPSLIATGCRAYHFGNAVSMREVLGQMPSHIVVMGNVDPVSQFVNGTPESIRTATYRLMEECRENKNLVISSGCDIPATAKWENIDAFFRAVSEFT